MKCPNCEVIITDINLKYCEFCGAELNFKKEISNSSSEKPLDLSKRRRHCC